MAAWISDEAWAALNEALTYLRMAEVDRSYVGHPASQDAPYGTLTDGRSAIGDATDLCGRELSVLEGARDNLPPHERGHGNWPPDEMPQPPYENS